MLDEPTIGLHPQDTERLLALLRDLAGAATRVLVVEHDRTLIRGADHVIDLGPRAGEHGGEVVAEGTVEEILRQRDVAHRPLPARRARRPRRASTSRASAASEGRETRRGRALPTAERLADPRRRGAQPAGIDVELPLGCLVAVTGVSGSGKSTLVEHVLYDNFKRSRGVADVEPGRCASSSGFEQLADMLLVDQRPLGRSSRSNPVTYIKAYDEIRKLFAVDRRARGAAASRRRTSRSISTPVAARSARGPACRKSTCSSWRRWW